MAEALAVHRPYVDIAHTSVREALNLLAAALAPAVVEQFVQLARADAPNRHLERLASLADAEAHLAPHLALEQGIVVLPREDLLAVDALDDAARLNVGLHHGEGALGYNLLDLESVALVLLIEEYPERSGRHRRTRAVVARTRMRGVQLAQHLGEHLREVVIVVYVGQEAGIDTAVVVPVHTVQVDVVELVLDLTPYVVEDIVALLVGAVVLKSLEADALGLAVGQRHAAQAAVADIEVLDIAVRNERPAADALDQNAGRVVLQVTHPQIHRAVLGADHIVELVARLRQQGQYPARRVGRKAHDAVTAVFEVELQRLHLRNGRLALLAGLLLGLLLILGLLLVAFLLLLRLVLLQKRQILLVHAELLIGLNVEEHDVDIILGAPRTVAAVARAVAVPDHRLAVQNPLGTAVRIAALRQVVHLARAVSLDQNNVLVVPAADADIVRQDPAAVGRPLEVLVSVRI